MNHKTGTFLVVVFLLAVSRMACGQRLVSHSIGALGYVAHVEGSPSLQWNVGEVVVGLTNGTARFNQGLYQLVDVSTATSPVRDKAALFDVYPNPAKETLFVRTTAHLQVGLTDVNGRVLKTNLTPIKGRNKVDISGFTKGNYYLFAYKEKEVLQVEEIIIQ